MNFINIIWEKHEQRYTYEINRFNFNVIRIWSAWLWMWSGFSVPFYSAEYNNLIDLKKEKEEEESEENRFLLVMVIFHCQLNWTTESPRRHNSGHICVGIFRGINEDGWSIMVWYQQIGRVSELIEEENCRKWAEPQHSYLSVCLLTVDATRLSPHTMLSELDTPAIIPSHHVGL